MKHAPGWFYFGCNNRQLGHHLWEPGMRLSQRRDLDHFDTVLAPHDTRDQFIACLTRIEPLGLSALAFWDNTVDVRPGGNSILYAPSLDISPQTLLVGFQERFPAVFSRWHRGITVRALK